jgi:hypothetical protein
MYLASEYLAMSVVQSTTFNLVLIALYTSIGFWINLRVRK